MIDEYEGVFFDAGGTLFRPYPSVGQIYHRVAARYGATCDADGLDHAFRECWLNHDGAHRGAPHPDAEEERAWWSSLVRDIFSRFGGVPRFDDFFAELYPIFSTAEAWQPYPDAADTLGELRRRGKRLGIISNWTANLPDLCDELGLADHFDVVISSAAVGVGKPSARIFEAALDAFGVDSTRAVHIGDSVSDDIEGARNAGLRGILVDRAANWKDHPAIEGVDVIHDLRALVDS